MTEYNFDAKNKRLGRLASEIAVILQGKNKASYDPKEEGDTRVVVKNIKEIAIGGDKVLQKIYYRHTGPLGHLKERRYKDTFAKKPDWVLRNAVRLMLPKNRLNAKRLKRLVIE